MKYRDLHNHTLWSDGENTVGELIDRAVDASLDQIGISDHFEAINDIEKYVEEIVAYRDRYQGIEILAGVEMRVETLLNLADQQLQSLGSKVDYLLIENLECKKSIHDVLGQLSSIIMRLECQVGWAHLDLERLKDSREHVLDFIADNKMFIDFNISAAFYENVIQGFEHIDDVVSREIEVIVGSDTHHFEEDWRGYIRTAHQFVNDLRCSHAINKRSKG